MLFRSIALATVLLAACAGGGGASTASPTPTATPTPVLPDDPNALVIGVRQEGGYVLREYLFARIPLVSVYADGRVIVQGPQIESYPGPLLPSLVVAKLDEATLLQLLESAQQAGLASGTNASYPATSVADAPDTVFSVRSGAALTETSFGGLGSDLDDNKTPAEVEARRAAAAFLAELETIATSGEGAGPFVPAAVRLLVQDEVPQPDLPQQPVDWPLASALGSVGTPYFSGDPAGGRCLVVEGADLATLWPVLGAANALTPFVSEGARFRDRKSTRLNSSHT